MFFIQKTDTYTYSNGEKINKLEVMSFLTWELYVGDGR